MHVWIRASDFEVQMYACAYASVMCGCVDVGKWSMQVCVEWCGAMWWCGFGMKMWGGWRGISERRRCVGVMRSIR